MSTTGLVLFQVPPTDFRFQSRREIKYQPVFPGVQPITFQIPASEDYIDLKDIKLEIQLRLTDPVSGYTGIEVEDIVSGTDGTDSDGTDTRNMFIVNNFAHSIFKQIDVKYNGILMTEQTNLYHYMAYLLTLINFSEEEGKNKLVPQGWVNGALNINSGAMSVGTANSDKIKTTDTKAYSDHQKLKDLTKKVQLKRWHTFVMKPYIPALRTGGYLAPGTALEMELHLNPNTFYLYGTPNKGSLTAKKFPTISANDIKIQLVIPKITLNQSVYNKLQAERRLASKTVKYPVVRPSIRTYSIPSGYTKWEEDNVFLGKLPDRVILALVHSDAFNGDVTRYPFCFERFRLTHIRQMVNGEEYPYRTLEWSNESNNKDSTDDLGYERFLQAMGAYREDKDPMIQPEDWGEGKNCTLFLFNNVPSGYPDDPKNRNPQQTGNVRYELTFGSATSNNITVIVWSEYENIIEINNQGGIKYNF